MNSSFLNNCKNNQDKPQNIPTEIKKNIKIAVEESLYAQVVMIHWGEIVQKGKNGENLK